VDLAARASATIGGTVATNAVGLHGIAFGATRAQVVGLEAVLADGTVNSSLERPAQTSLGPDWGQLLIGSEGTLGVVTAVRVRLRPADGSRALAALPARSAAEAVAVLRAARRLPGLRAVEWVSAEMAALAGGPFAGYALVEVGAPTADAALEVLSELDPPVVAVDAERMRLWAPREGCSDAVQQAAGERGQVVHKLDVAVPVAQLERVVEGLPSGSQVFGHIGVGTLHINVIGPDNEEVDETVLQWVASCGGAIAAEHGIGRAKVPWLGLSLSDGEMSLLRNLKSALDPAGRLNPGVLL
jgi:FAD/FMN-containing dehydrogenase